MVTVVVAEGAEATVVVALVLAAAGPVEETEAGEAGAGVVAGSVSEAALVGVGAVVGAVAGAGGEAAPVAGEGASAPGDQLNAGCDAGDCGKDAAGWPLWMPPFSYAGKR